MPDGPDPNLIQSGNLIEHLEHTNPGFYETKDKPNVCPCCFKEHYWERGFSQVLGRRGFEPHVCAYGDYWIMDEWGQQTCESHKVEKIKDGLFGCLPGSFTTPGGLTVFKRPDSRAVAPIVRSRKKSGKRE